ncbi:MAG: hypothetical protein IT424_03425 [Pirellulales bacterium]|nr:hypothetical protein [Pirellulales bacterium]
MLDNGRFQPDFGTSIGNAQESYFFRGNKRINPFIAGRTTETAMIAGLAGGADVYGILEGVDAFDPYFQHVQASAPANAIAAVMRVESNPLGDAYPQDSLLIVNLTLTPLQSPTLGVGRTIEIPLLSGGFLRDAMFGGSGEPVPIASLPAGGVYTTLLPTGNPTEIVTVNVSVAGAALSNVSLLPGEFAFIGGALPGDFNVDGQVDGVDFLSWQQGGSPNPYSTSDLHLWNAGFGSPASAELLHAVPEPDTGALLLSCVALLACGNVIQRRGEKSEVRHHWLRRGQ